MTASGGGWNDAPWAMAVWIWLNLTKPRAVISTAMAMSIRIIRFAMKGLLLLLT